MISKAGTPRKLLYVFFLYYFSVFWLMIKLSADFFVTFFAIFWNIIIKMPF